MPDAQSIAGADFGRLAVYRVRELDSWPRTTRLTPWLLAGFLSMLFLVPFDAIDLPLALPFDSKLDRLVLVFLLLAAGVHMTLYPRRIAVAPTPIILGLIGFVSVAIVSLVLNLEVTTRLGDSTRGVKNVVLLLCYALFFVAVAKTVRPSEVRNFVVYVLGLAVVLAVGTIWEYRTGFNVFYDVAQQTFGRFADVGQPPPDPKYGRATIVGPGIHALVPVTMLAMTLPFAMVGLMDSDRRHRWAYAAVVALLLAGTVATIRKAAFVAPMAAILIVSAYRPRDMLRLAPLGLVLLVMVQAVAPGAAVTVKAQFINVSSRNTTQGRTNDYPAIRPDVFRDPVLGRGYGTYDPLRYRILDNQWLGLIISTGFLGAAAFLGMLLAAVWTAHPVIRSGSLTRAGPALAGAAAAVSFGVTGLLFDILSFPQVPYIFFFLTALVAVVATAERIDAKQDVV